MIGIIRKPNIFDVNNLVINAREADKYEAFLLSGRSLKEAFDATPNLYENSYVWEVDSKLVCMYGVSPWVDNKNILWFLATDDFEKYRRCAAVECKEIFDKLTKGRGEMFNYIHYRHEKALRWVQWLGCKIHDPEPIGLNGELFCKFEVNNV